MEPVDPNVSFPRLEQKILEVWQERDIFRRSMDPRAPQSLAADSSAPGELRKSYVFYDGPPFATGLPHYGHLLAGTIKDVIGRFFTMKGFHVDRRFGWDCHGVPVEFEIQKKLELYGAKAVREFGIDRFNEECRSIVLRYTKEWEQFVRRSGRWVDFDRQYRTMDLEFMESVWWALKSLWDRGLIYEGFKCVAYSTGINTPLSNFEANLNYKSVQDPAITIRAELHDEARNRLELPAASNLPVYAYVWTTTPWTLPSNMAIAAGEQIRYVAVLVPGKEYAIVAKALARRVFPELPEDAHMQNGGADDAPIVVAEFLGSRLVDLPYTPFFPYFEKERANNAFRIYSGDFVSEEDGTGLVHLASFGEDDLAVFQKHQIPIVDPVDEDGRFDAVVSDFAGQYIKDADPKIIAALKQRGLLVQHQTIEHSYPFCWRTDTPLIYKSISSWFVRVEQIQDLLLHANSTIRWVPDHIKDGRFGKWLEGARDWAISRNRFWGTPLPIWRCDSCAQTRCLGSVAELEALSKAEVTDLHSHRIDHLTFSCESCAGTMRRIPEVLDCWFESGAMPYGQAHYPFEQKEQFEEHFPADFIAEGLDQTRGWFYTLLVLSTALFGRPAFRNVIVNGIVLAEDGRKMSKSLQNYPPPDKVMNEHGADALRLYLLSSAATRAEELRFSEEGVRQVVRQTLLPLWNAYNFLVTYAQVDQWTPAALPDEPSPNILDRWILSKIGSLVDGVDTALSSYHLYSAAQPILDFVDQLTNWYIRLNRRRFWAGNKPAEVADKQHAYATLHQALLSFVRVLAPLAPFISEEIFQNLSRELPGLSSDSVHLTPFPSREELQGLEIDRDLEHTMELFEEIILLGRGLRNDHGLKVRQPLAKLTVVYPDAAALEGLRQVDAYIRDELNVKEVAYTAEEEEIVTLSAKLNTRRLGKVLGPKLGREKMAELNKRVQSLSTDEIRAIERGGSLQFYELELTGEDLLISRSPKSGMDAAASSGQITIVLDTALTQELRLEGSARDFVNRVQKLRKDMGFDVADRIITRYMTACPRLTTALVEFREYVMQETLSVEMGEVTEEDDLKGSSTHLPSLQEIDGKSIIISLTRIQA
ncbi:MAG: isoleucine--tRNA ligase [Bdellovibrionales bacterium]|nr:isoleucine--tRNA ligase [Bdellovibrionales bacterium]